MSATYEYGRAATQPPVRLRGTRGAQAADLARQRHPGWNDGCLLSAPRDDPRDYNRHVLLPENTFAGFRRPEPTLRRHRSPREWLKRLQDRPPLFRRFRILRLADRGEPLATVAYRLGKKIEWDAANLRATNATEGTRSSARVS